jgi:hypothetical protein
MEHHEFFIRYIGKMYSHLSAPRDVIVECLEKIGYLDYIREFKRTTSDISYIFLASPNELEDVCLFLEDHRLVSTVGIVSPTAEEWAVIRDPYMRRVLRAFVEGRENRWSILNLRSSNDKIDVLIKQLHDVFVTPKRRQS